MANYRAVATGNWSSGATWGGGVVPPNGEAHNIYSNGFTVTIDTNVDVALITNAAITASFVGGGTSAAAGGGFSVSAATTSIVANITAGASITAGANLLSYGQVSPSACTITGNLTGASNSNGAFGCNAVVLSGSGTLTINGNLRAGGTAGGSANAVSVTGGGTLIVNSSIISTQGSFATAAASSAINLSGAGAVTLNNCQLNAATSYPAVNTTAGTVTAINCIFTASTAGAALSSTATGNRLSGTFISASNGMQPINAARWFLNTTPTNSYIQQALDGINANSYVRYYTADNALGQANPTDVRSGASYASGNLTGRLTVPARGSVALSVNYGPSMPFTATRSGTTATATLAYSYPLVVGDQITVTGASNAEWNTTYTIASIVSGTSVTFEVPASHSATAGTGATMQTTGTAVLDPASIASAVQNALTAQGLTSARAGNLDNLDASVSSRSTLTAAQVNGEADTALADVGLTTTITARIDQAISTRLAAADYTAPSAAPTVTAIRQELDANSTKLANLDASVSSRLADADYASAPSVSDIRAELAVELGRLDASVSSRLAGSAYTAPTTPPTAAEITTAVWAAADKTGYSLSSAERTAIAAAVESSILNEADGQAVLNAIVGAIGNTNLSEVSLVAAVRADLERTGGKLDSIPTTSAPSASTVAGAVWSAAARTVTGGTVDNLTNAPASVTPSDIWSHTTRTLTSGGAPSAVQIRQEMDANSTKLANLDAPVSGATAPSAATVASAVRAELTEISRLDVAVSSRMAGSEATKLDAVKAKTDALNTDRLAQCATTQIVGSLIAQANS